MWIYGLKMLYCIGAAVIFMGLCVVSTYPPTLTPVPAFAVALK